MCGDRPQVWASQSRPKFLTKQACLPCRLGSLLGVLDMIAINMATHGLFVIALALTPTERWNAASSFFAGSSPDGSFTILAVISLILAVALLFWVFARSKRSQHGLALKVREWALRAYRD